MRWLLLPIRIVLCVAVMALIIFGNCRCLFIEWRLDRDARLTRRRDRIEERNYRREQWLRNIKW